MNVVVIKYKAGNIQSVLFALERLGISPLLSSEPETIAKADKVIFPGVGEASSTMKELHSMGLESVLQQLKQPFLGICLGLQIMCRHSEEGDVDCLNIFDSKVKKFESAPAPVQPDGTPEILKVPHMGWNIIRSLQGPLFKGVAENSYVYYVHSYYAELGQDTCAATDYINPFSAALMKDNYFAVQFHLEKSGKTGETILKNFIDL